MKSPGCICSSLFLSFPGLGSCAVLLVSVVVLQQYFKKRRALTSGIASAGLSLGGLAIGPCYRALIDLYGWRTTLIIHACVLLQTTVIGATYRPLGAKKATDKLPVEEKAEPREDDQETEAWSQEKDPSSPPPPRNRKSKLSQMVDLSLFRNRQFLLYMAAMFGVYYSLNTMYLLGPSRAVSQGMDKFRASLLPSMIAISSLISRVINSVVANVKCLSLFAQLSALSVGCGLFVCLSCMTSSFWGSIVFCAFYGTCCGKS